MKMPYNYKSEKCRGLNGCWNCTHCVEDFDLYCYLTIEAVPVFNAEYSFLSMYYVEAMDICDWRKNEGNGSQKTEA